MIKISDLKFPGFYEECAYRDGAADAADAFPSRIASFLRRGEPEPVGMEWYQKGFQAKRLGLVA